MEAIEKIKDYHKVVLLGDNNLGKTQLYNAWLKLPVNNAPNSSMSISFQMTTIIDGNVKRKLQIWDIPSDVSNPSQIRDTQLYIIIIAAQLDTQEKIKQINRWLSSLDEYPSQSLPISIIETYDNVTDVTLLTETDLQKISRKFAFHLGFSLQHIDRDISLLNKNILSLFAPANANAPIPLQMNALPLTNLIREEIKQKIINLSTEQTAKILNSLFHLLLLGPINEKGHHYDLRLGGITPVINGKTYDFKVPQHVFDWLIKINSVLQGNIAQNQVTLLEILDDLHTISVVKPFSRSPTTHDFFKNSLIGFIHYTVLMNERNEANSYFNLRQNTIKELHPNSLSTILNWLINLLISGPHNNKNAPYSLNFFGGKKHLIPHSKETVRVATHAGALLNYLSSIDSIDMSAVKHYHLLIALDYTIAIGYSVSADRDPSTIVFYSKLTSQLINKIIETHNQSYQLRSTLSNSA